MPLTDEEKRLNAIKSAKEWRRTQLSLAIPKDITEILENERKKYEESLPFKVKKGQFIAVILDHWVKTNGHS